MCSSDLHKRQLVSKVDLAGPADDELLRIRIEVALEKGRGIERVKELRELAQAQFDPLGLAGIHRPEGRPRERPMQSDKGTR